MCLDPIIMARWSERDFQRRPVKRALGASIKILEIWRKWNNDKRRSGIKRRRLLRKLGLDWRNSDVKNSECGKSGRLKSIELRQREPRLSDFGYRKKIESERNMRLGSDRRKRSDGG
jgi:hypothetical protein